MIIIFYFYNGMGKWRTTREMCLEGFSLLFLSEITVARAIWMIFVFIIIFVGEAGFYPTRIMFKRGKVLFFQSEFLTLYRKKECHVFALSGS